MPSSGAVSHTSFGDEWSDRVVAVAGLGSVGLAAVDALHHIGATVIGIDTHEIASNHDERAKLFTYLGVKLHHGESAPSVLDNLDLVVVAEQWMADSSIVAHAYSRGIPIWSEAELAWQIRGEEPAPWLTVAGSRSGSATAVILERILSAAGVRALAVGNQHASLLESVMDPEGPAVLIVELSETQLRWPTTLSPVSAVAVDAPTDDTLFNPFSGTQIACVYSVQNAGSRRLAEDADVVEGARAVGVSMASPGFGDIGLVENIVADRAFGDDPRHEAEELFTLDDLGDVEAEVVISALAASAVARSVGVKSHWVKIGIGDFASTLH
ncbi:MAG: hypothetical protein GX678_01670 [Actinomycetales bacterium]|nr:hypothetical protein [Actinomycetales bacterium]